MTFGLSLDSSGGLETSSGNLRVKLQSPSGLDRTSTGVALADGVAGNGLTIAAKVLALGTPSTLTPVSTNAVTSVSHTHSLDSASDVGTTPAQKVLASTGTGGLILKTLQVKVNLDVDRWRRSVRCRQWRVCRQPIISPTPTAAMWALWARLIRNLRWMCSGRCVRSISSGRTQSNSRTYCCGAFRRAATV